MPYRLKVMENGRMSLPVELRRRMGLANGGEVVVEDRGDRLVLRTVQQAVAKAQALSRKALAKSPNASVEDFISERRQQAESE